MRPMRRVRRAVSAASGVRSTATGTATWNAASIRKRDSARACSATTATVAVNSTQQAHGCSMKNAICVRSSSTHASQQPKPSAAVRQRSAALQGTLVVNNAMAPSTNGTATTRSIT